MRKRRALGSGLNDYPLVGYIKIGALPVPSTGFVDTGTRYSILPKGLADAAGARSIGKTGKLNILNRSMRGELRRVRMSSIDGQCSGETTVFVPTAGDTWGKGVLLGAEFLQDTGMHTNNEGEAYCPLRASRNKKRRR